MASASRVGAWVERSATQATFLANWADPALGWVPRAPQNAQEVSVRLRAPNGKLVSASEPTVRRLPGAGYVGFKLDDPLPGQWWVEVETARPGPTPYTVGGFVRSPVRIDVAIDPLKPLRGSAIDVRVDVSDGRRGVTDLTGTACISVPGTWPGKLIRDLAARLRDLRPVRTMKGDVIPEEFGQVLALERAAGRPGRPLIGYRTTCKKMAAPPPSGGGTTPPGGSGGGGGGVVVVTPPLGGTVGGGVVTTAAADESLPAADPGAIAFLRPALAHGLPIRDLIALTRPGPARLTAQLPGSAHPGSVNATVTVQGATRDGDRFVRTTTRSVRVR